VAQRPIALCISGINYGENVGSGITISGTVGAAIDAACFGIPTLAASFETPKAYHLSHSRDIDFTVAAHFTRCFAQQILNKGLPAGVDFLKLDVPSTATPETPWQVTSVSRQRYYDLVYQGQPGLNNIREFDYTVKVVRDQVEPESDVYAFVVDHRVTVVPMTIDMTAPVPLSEVDQFFKNP
jgi:5'-nucleotidase